MEKQEDRDDEKPVRGQRKEQRETLTQGRYTETKKKENGGRKREGKVKAETHMGYPSQKTQNSLFKNSILVTFSNNMFNIFFLNILDTISDKVLLYLKYWIQLLI